MSGSLNDGVRGTAKFTLTQAIVLHDPNKGEFVSICELTCGRARMGFFAVPDSSNLSLTCPVLPGVFADFLPLPEHRKKATVADDLMPYIHQALQFPAAAWTPRAVVQHYVGLFGSLKLLDPHDLNRELIALAYLLDESIRSQVDKHISLPPRIYQLQDYADQSRVLEAVLLAHLNLPAS